MRMAALLSCKFLSIPRSSICPIALQSAAIKSPIRPSYVCSSSLPKSANLKATHAQPPSRDSLSTVVTDESVPEGHAGLHGFLYGEKGSEVHGDNTQQITANPGEDDGSSIIPFQDYVNNRENLKFAGVYAIYTNENQIQFVGYSRNVIMSLKSHLDRVGPSMCCSVRVKIFTDPSLLSRGRLEEEKNKWIDEYGVPPGNSSDQDSWDCGQVLSIKAMSEEERKDYEEKKLKLRKAMGENLYDEVEGEDEESSIRRLNLLRATEGDDWSGVIDRQTKETLEEKCEGTQSNNNNEQTEAGIVSPFSDNGNGSGTAGLYSSVTHDLTPENVDVVLNDVRPYLVADGGNVEVASVQHGVISLRLQALLSCKFLSIPRSSICPIALQSAAIKSPIRPSYVCSSSLPKSANLKATHAQPPSRDSLSTVVTDESVPEGHAGLHGFLYGEKGLEVHGHNTQQITANPGEDDGSSIISFQDYLNNRENLKFAGVYAIYTNENQIQFVGYCRNVIMSLKSHLDRVGPSMCCSVRVKIFTDPSLLSRGRLEEEKNKWIDEYGVPPGNSSDQDLWDCGQVLSIKVTSEEERKDYEKKKLKLWKAMGENLYDEVEGEDEESSIRRLNLLRATEGDDWSGVIDRQTKETLEEKCEGTQSNNNNEQTEAGIVVMWSCG